MSGFPAPPKSSLRARSLRAMGAVLKEVPTRTMEGKECGPLPAARCWAIARGSDSAKEVEISPFVLIPLEPREDGALSQTDSSDEMCCSVGMFRDTGIVYYTLGYAPTANLFNVC